MRATLLALLLTASLHGRQIPITDIFLQETLHHYSIQTSHGEIAVWDTGGTGKPVLFIHGNSSCKELFLRQFESDLTQQYRFISIDLPGHGHSERAKEPEKTYNLTGYAETVIEVIDQLKLKNPAALGWSLGGHILLSTLEKGQSFSGIIITGTPPIEISFQGFLRGFLPQPRMAILLSQTHFSKDDAKRFATYGFDVDLKTYPFIVEAVEKADGNARTYLTASLKQHIGGNQKAIVETSDTPLCIIQGKNEKSVNNEYLLNEIHYKNLFNNHVYVIEDSGHVCFWEQPEEFNRILGEFLSQR